MTRGICYVVWGDSRYTDRTVAAAKLSPVPTCVIADHGRPLPDGIFTHVVRTDLNVYPGFYRKMVAFLLTPFDTTLYTDSDVKITGDIDLVFRGAEKYGFTCTYSPGQVFQYEGVEYPHYNGGYFAFAGKRPDVAREWQEQGKAFDPVADEAPFSMALDKLGINPFVVPTIFNMVAAGWVHPRPIRGWHSVSYPPQSHLVSVFDNPFDRTAD